MDYFVSVDAIDLTEYVKTSTWEVNPDVHDITGSGRRTKRARGGQVGTTFSMGGWYESDPVNGPAMLEDLAGTTVAFVRQVEGPGTGKPNQACSVVVGKYVESQKNDDITQWTCDFTIDGDVTKTVQA
jgi:hypothetical protein